MLEMHRIEGELPLGMPDESIVNAHLTLTSGGDFTITFNSFDLGEAIMRQARNNTLMALGLHYVAARPS